MHMSMITGLTKNWVAQHLSKILGSLSGIFSLDLFLAVAQKSLDTSSPIFPAEKIWFRCSNPEHEQSSLLTYGPILKTRIKQVYKMGPYRDLVTNNLLA